jgi:nondiscriminating glutamyl-tRNA synthetase
MKKVRTRFAPSPTGSVHIGSVQKIVYSYAFSKHHNGDYILRIEDTDQSRYVETAETEIYRAHELLGIEIDESPQHSGEYGPYKQSDRLKLYKEYVDELIEKGYAYYAFETAEELAEMRAIQQAAGERPKYDGKYRDYDIAEAKQRVSNGEKFVVRIKTPKEQKITYEDMIMGKVEFNSADVDDYVLMKSDGFPTYHLANVVDDHLMGISHVFRGVEWIPTSPVHVLLYEYFGWEQPKFAHIPNILDPKGGKLSKRSGSVALMDFFAKGYLADAIINFITLLGWSPKNDREMFTLNELIEHFDANNFNKSNPVFDRDKLDWFNGEYIRKMSATDLTNTYKNWVTEFTDNDEAAEINKSLGEEKLLEAIKLEQERISVLSDLPGKLKYFQSGIELEFDFTHKFLKKLANSEVKAILEEYLQLLEENSNEEETTWNHDKWEESVRSIVDKQNRKAREVFMCLRIVITGSSQSPPLFEFAKIIGKQEEIARIKSAISQLQG